MNPVQFKVSTTEPKKKIQGMTVFNKFSPLMLKNNQCFWVLLLEYKDMIHSNIQSLTNLQLNNLVISGGLKRFHYKKIVRIIRLSDQNRNIFTLPILSTKSSWILAKERGPGMLFIPHCSLPELESCMEVWGFMEMIHSRSYTLY